MEKVPGRYLAYLLRLWLVDGEPPVWRASLEDARTGERRGFPDLESAVEFLQEQMTVVPPASRGDPRPPFTGGRAGEGD